MEHPNILWFAENTLVKLLDALDIHKTLCLPTKPLWLVVSTHLKNIRQIGSFPQIVVKIKNIWHQPETLGSSGPQVELELFKPEGIFTENRLKIRQTAKTKIRAAVCNGKLSQSTSIITWIRKKKTRCERDVGSHRIELYHA